MKKRRCKINVGDVVQIKLPTGNFAYGRVFKDASIGIYKHQSELPDQPPREDDYAFIVGFYKDALTSGIWPVIEHRPFASDDTSWPPSNYIYDRINGQISIYYRGTMRPSTEAECRGMEKAAVWEANHIIDRIMGSTKWHKPAL